MPLNYKKTRSLRLNYSKFISRENFNLVFLDAWVSQFPTFGSRHTSRFALLVILKVGSQLIFSTSNQPPSFKTLRQKLANVISVYFDTFSRVGWGCCNAPL
jgi:hypothetical protein